MFFVMKKIELKKKYQDPKTGSNCTDLNPTINQSCIFTVDGQDIGFYIHNVHEISDKLANLVKLVDYEFLSDRVPKTMMARATGKNRIQQYSTILGGIPPKPAFKRNYVSMSSVHNYESATNFIKAMILLLRESCKIYEKILPEMYQQQQDYFDSNVEKKWHFGGCPFTSTISNFDIAAPYHIDKRNIKNTCNIIFNRKINAIGGDLSVPAYGHVIESADLSMIVYPAWRDMHGVTPIKKLQKNGYRNSHIFYPLQAFVKG